MWPRIIGCALVLTYFLTSATRHGIRNTISTNWRHTLPVVIGIYAWNWSKYDSLTNKAETFQARSREKRTIYCPPPGSSLPPPMGVGIGGYDRIDRQLPFQWSPCVPGTPLYAYSWGSSTTLAVKGSIGNDTLFQYARHADSLATTVEASSEIQASVMPNWRDPGESLYDTKFRVASVTKLFTVLAVLLSKDKIGWDDPITQHVPELNPSTYAKVTIGALAGHASGLGRFGYVGDLSHILGGPLPSFLGLQPVDKPLPGCDPVPGGRVCSREEVIEMFNNPAYGPQSPNSGPLYSNIAYILLGMALEAAHSHSFQQVIQDLILDPLGMRQSSFETPDHKNGVLPRKGEKWAVPSFANFDPAGGLWSSPDDMLRFLRAILQHRLLSPAETRKWLQPHSVLPVLEQLVGAPWEILRPTDLNVKAARPIDIYTKSGSIAGYASFAILIPEYDIAVTMNAAGDNAVTAVQDLLPVILKPVVAFADEAAREQAAVKYAGTYTRLQMNSSITLALDDGPGLAITSLIITGVSMLERLAQLKGAAPEEFSARVYPTDPDSLGTEREVWRILFDGKRPNTTWAGMDCLSWNWGDPLRYAGMPLDIMTFKFKGEKAASVELMGWRTTLLRHV